MLEDLETLKCSKMYAIPSNDCEQVSVYSETNPNHLKIDGLIAAIDSLGWCCQSSIVHLLYLGLYISNRQGFGTKVCLTWGYLSILLCRLGAAWDCMLATAVCYGWYVTIYHTIRIDVLYPVSVNNSWHTPISRNEKAGDDAKHRMCGCNSYIHRAFPFPNRLFYVDCSGICQHNISETT